MGGVKFIEFEAFRVRVGFEVGGMVTGKRKTPYGGLDELWNRLHPKLDPTHVQLLKFGRPTLFIKFWRALRVF